jgi:hypothetical protein
MISLQAQTIAEEAARGCEQAPLALDKALRARSTIIDPIQIAQANEQIKITEVTLWEMGFLWYHAAAGFPPKETFIRAICNGNYAT